MELRRADKKFDLNQEVQNIEIADEADDEKQQKEKHLKIVQQLHGKVG